ncbi:MAG: ATP-binding protein [Candidatus Limnocylindrales bacterium]
MEPRLSDQPGTSPRGDGLAAPPAPLGRESELGNIEAFLTAVEAAFDPAALILIGDAGVGKTILLQAAVARAAERGWRIMRASPDEAEQELPHAALSDLLRDVDPEAIADLPEPQRLALAVALSRAAPAHGSIAPGTVAAGLLGTIRRLADAQPVLLAVDDVQWLDAATRSALAYALRRCDGVRVGILAGLRGGADETTPLGLARALGPGRLGRLVVGPVSTGTLFQLLRTRLGHAFARPELLRVAEWSGGNPLFALEIGRAILERGRPLQPGESPPVSPDLSMALGDRIRGLPSEVRRTLLLAALATRPTMPLVRAAGDTLSWAIDLPDDASLIRERAPTIRFAHPLLRAEAAGIATADDRRASHRALADLTAGPEERARHLALALTGPDATVAEALEGAASDALARGAPETAAELLELSCQATPPDAAEALCTRRTQLARLVARNGDGARARALLRQTVAEAPRGAARARGRAHLARLVSQVDGPAAAVAMCRGAVVEVGDDPVARGEVELAWSAVTQDAAERLEHASAAMTLLRDGPARLLANALAGVALAEASLGRPVPWELLDQAIALEAADPPERVVDRAEASRAWLRLMDDDFERAHRGYTRLRRIALALGDESSLAQFSIELAQIDLRLGRWDELAEHAAEALAIAERNDRERDRVMAIIQLGAVAAARGDADEATRHLDEAGRFAAHTGDPFVAGIAAGNRGALALALGNAAEAEAHFRELDGWFSGAHLADPALTRYQGDQLEALVELGHLDRASALVDELEARARPAGRRRALAFVARGRALLAAAAGDLNAALEEATRSYDELTALGLRYQAARSLLVRGMLRRRRREKRLAHEDLSAAIATFEELRATAWAARARQEIGRIGLRPRASDTLSDTEQTVARLAAAGHTSREIAALAFMSPRTVEGVLTRVYHKLGVGSRAELGRAMADWGAGQSGA